MAATRWIFTKEHLQNTPSRKSGIDDDKELSYRQQAANLIQDMGQRLAVNSHPDVKKLDDSFAASLSLPVMEIAPACIFLAAKVEEQPKKLEVVIKVAHTCLNTPFPDIKSEAYLEQAQQLVNNENTLLKTLGFEVTVDHPHTHVVKVTNLVKASKDLSQTSYYLATNSLHMTMFCLQYKPTEVACACIYLASKWSMYKIPRSNEGREWWQYVDPSITLDLLEEIKTEFLNILDKYPSKLKKRIMGGWKGTKEEGGSQSSPQHCDPNRPLSSTSAAYHKYTNHDRNEISDPRKQSINKPNKHPQEANKQDIVEFDKMCILLGKHGVEASKHDGDTSKHNVSEIIKHGIESNKHGSEVSKHGPDSGRHPHYDPKHLIDRVGQLEHSKVERKDLLADKKFTERKEMAAYLDRNLLPNPAHDQKLVTKDESISSRRKEGHPLRPVEIPAGHDRKDALSLTKEPSCNGKPHSSSSQQSTLAPLNIKLHLETVQDSSVVKNEPKPTVTMTALPSQLGAPINSVEMRRVKSETAINYKEYLKRKEQEKLLPQKTVENSANMNNTFSECNSRDRKYPPLKLGTSLPIVNNLHEQQTNNKEIMERPYEVNIKSPIKPHYNITVKSPIKSSDLKQPKLEISKMQITPEKDSSDPFSVNVNTDPYFRKLMAGMKSELCYLSDSDRVLATTMNGEVPHSVKNGFNTNEKLDIESKIRPTHESHELFDSSDLDISLKPEHSAAPNVKIKELGFDPDMGFASSAALKYSKLESGNCKLTPIPSQIKPDTNSDTNTPVTLKLTGQSNNISPLKIKISTIGVPLDSDQCSREHLPSRHKHKHKDKHRSHKHSHESKRHRDKHREKSLSTGTTADVINGQSQPLKLNIKLSDLPNHSSASNESLSVKQKHLTHISKHRASDTTSNKQYVVLSDPAVSNNNLADSLERQQPWSVSDLKTNPQSSQQEQLTSWKRRHAPTSDKNEQSSNPKAAKMAVKRLRRSSSSHSVVSMEMSDGEEGHTNGPMIQAINPPHVVNQIQERLQSLIAQTKEKVQSLQLQQQQQRKHVIRQRSHASHSSPFEAFNVVNRQQSGFDLDSAMWIGRGGDQPPLPPSMLTPPPPPPEQIVRPPLPPNH